MHLNQAAKLTAMASSLVAGYATLASAHSWKDCAWDVIEFCGSDQACRDSGIAQCSNHTHPGNPPPEPPEPNMSATPQGGGGVQSGSGGAMRRR